MLFCLWDDAYKIYLAASEENYILNAFLMIIFVYFRIRTERKGGAWCPKQAIQKDVFEYLQIDLDKLMVITMVETQGRFGNGKVCT